MTDNAINKVLYNLDQRADTTAEEKKTARDNIGALGPDELASVADERYKLLQSPLLQTYAANAVIDRVEQNAQGVVNVHCSYLNVATGDSNGLMSSSDKNKLDSIQYGAEVNAQADWLQDDPESDSYIQNKPTFLQTQADWAQGDPNVASYIQNKPDLSQYATQQDLSGKQDVLTAGDNITITNNVISATAAPQQQASWTETDSTSVSYIQNKPDLATVATTGEYSDLLHVPDLTQYKPKQAVVGESFAANAVIDRLDQDANGVVSIHCSYLSTATTSADGLMSLSDKTKLDGIQSGAEVNVQASWTESDSSSDSYIQNKPNLATVATTGEYSDLLHVPDLTQYKTKQSVIAETFAANAVIDRLDQTANGEVSVHCSYLSTATSSADGLMSSSDKAKLDGIASGAEVNVQASWTESDSSSDSYIQNKPSNLVQDANYVHTDNNFSNADKTKLDGIAAGAEVNVQSDWLQGDSLADDFIKNKPLIPVLPPTKELVAGTGISLVEGNDSVTISSTVTADDVAVMTYGTSTLADYTAARTAGKKLIVCKYHDIDFGDIYALLSSTSPYPVWSVESSTAIVNFRLNYGGVDGWTTSTTPLTQVQSTTTTTPPVTTRINTLTVKTNGEVIGDASTLGLMAPYGLQADEGKVLTHHYSGSPGICWASWDAAPEQHTFGFIDII